MLHSRVAGYETKFFHELVYDERQFFDSGGWLAVRSMEELPYWRALMRREREHERMQLVAEAHGDAIIDMRRALRELGTLANRDFESTDRKAIYGYRGAKETSLALYYLWRTGEAMTHHRNGFERVYTLADAVAPAHLLTEVDDAETDRFIVRKEIAFMGIGRPGSYSRLLVRTVKAAEARAIEDDLVETGELTPVAVPGWRGRNFVVTGDLELLDEVARGEVPAAWTPIATTTEEEVTLLSPLDPATARGRAKALFDFEYVWEIYKKPELVQYGRYTMPILWGDRLVGRIDPKMDRATGTLVINGIWWEDDGVTRVAAFRDALRAGVARFAAFLEAARVDASAVPDVRIRRAIQARGSRRAAVGNESV